jgi:hypothetical protein
MAERFIENDGDRKMLVRFIEAQKLPMTVNIEIGRQRSKAQNRLQRKWMKEIADQLGDQTPEEVRGFCKLTIGVPILRMENERFREAYDRRVRPMPYEQKMAFMMEPFDLAVTRIMTTKQKTAYLDGVHRYFSERGIVLTNPGDLVWSEPEQRAA